MAQLPPTQQFTGLWTLAVLRVIRAFLLGVACIPCRFAGAVTFLWRLTRILALGASVWLTFTLTTIKITFVRMGALGLRLARPLRGRPISL
jgi:hypothetical protein